MGPVLEAFFAVTSKSIGAAYRAGRGYDGRAVGWATVLAASLASALYAPMVIGSVFAVGGLWDLLESDFLWILGLLLAIPILFVVAAAVSGVAFGLTIGAWLITDRPAARWHAGFFAAGGLLIGGFVASMGSWVTQVVGWSTMTLAVALVLSLLLPRLISRSAPPADAPSEPGPEPEPVDPFTSPPVRTRRFVL